MACALHRIFDSGRHSLGTVAPLEFQKWVVDTGWTNDNTCGPATLRPAVKNLIVSNVQVTEGTVDYFKWDPDAGGTLAAPVITFTIEDADPHTYDCVVYYRATSGSQTWEGNPYWAATKTGCPPGPVTISLAADATSGHLDPEVHGWGSYTFDIVVTEHDGAAQVDRYGYKEPYCLWVPTTGGDGEPGHEWWTWHGSSAPEIRASYWLNDQCERDADQLAMVVVDPQLQERAFCDGPLEVSSRHGGTDEDGDDQLDGISVYQGLPDDPEGYWRVIWTAADACGPRAEHRRTHDAQRMLAANQGKARQWKLTGLTGEYASARWHAAVCDVHGTHRQTLLFASATPGDPVGRVAGYLQGILPCTAAYAGHAAAGVNGGLFGGGGVIVGDIGTGSGWPSGYCPDSPVRDCFAMDAVGPGQRVTAMQSEQGVLRTPLSLRSRFAFGRSHVGDLLASGSGHGQAISWPCWDTRRDRSLCFVVYVQGRAAYFAMVAAEDNEGWTWTQAVSFLQGPFATALRGQMRGLRISKIGEAAMLDGGGSTQFCARWVLRGGRGPQLLKDEWASGSREVTDIVYATEP